MPGFNDPGTVFNQWGRGAVTRYPTIPVAWWDHWEESSAQSLRAGRGLGEGNRGTGQVQNLTQHLNQGCARTSAPKKKCLLTCGTLNASCKSWLRLQGPYLGTSGVVSFPCLSQFLIPAAWDHRSDKPSTPRSLSQALLLGELRLFLMSPCQLSALSPLLLG